MLNEKLNQRIREALKTIPHVEEKKMFRGLAFMVDGKMCITASDQHMMCRIDPIVHHEVIQRKGCHTMIMGGKEYIGYVQIEEDVIKSAKEFNFWIRLALDFNPRAKASKKKK
jgi:TfoX/Sxy family transcriptional regulator of competence genes